MSDAAEGKLDPVAQRNYSIHLLSLSLTKLGDALTSSRLVLAWMLSSLGAPPLTLSLLVPVRESLALLPQLLVARGLERHTVRKWFWVFGSLGQACALLAMALALVILPTSAAAWAVIGALAVFSLSRGVCSIAIKDVMGRVIPKSHRGRLSGTAASVAGVITIGVALFLWLAPQGLRSEASTFVIILVGAALLWVAAALVYGQVSEEPATLKQQADDNTGLFSDLAIIIEQRPFRQFLIARMLLVATAFAIPYIVILVQAAGANVVIGLAVLLAAEGLSALLSGRVWGIWSDSAAHRVMAAGALLCVATLGATLYLSHYPLLLSQPAISALVIFTAATAHHGVRIGRSTYLIDLADDSNRARYTAVGNTVMGLFLLSGAALGAVDGMLGTQSVILLLMGLGVIAAIASLRLQPV
ncbi:permease, major facilitator superfamily [Luminiphilus syltensis NOR5-1B]|uniref:Permease, major facilitator superfamily n=1 Tax=Luminiphilus syltensis NOR5-1B TaxID=565045 RepID=B8KTS1_9GAMM|nr:permease, major facilitator superfamily [Luminiphilus syltensis]EED35502.1 permease, major facilitator superfamily [Luminiphilus syltensis NOR5-1B]